MTKDELLAALETALEAPEDAKAVLNRWLARGDGVAVYENQELGNPELGHKQFVSYGASPEAQIQGHPPTRMPDIGQSINWRYQLIGMYEGETL